MDLVCKSPQAEEKLRQYPPRNPKMVKLKGFLKGLRARREDVKAAKKSLFRKARG